MKKTTVLLFIVLASASASGFELPTTIFPLDNYNQSLEYWIKPFDCDYDEPLISVDRQKELYQEFYNHYYASGDNSLSPWSGVYVKKILDEKISKLSERAPIVDNGNSVNIDITKEIYGENYQPYPKQWINSIIHNQNLKQFQISAAIKYNPNNRGITIKNLLARSLPTIEPAFYKPSLPGEGYPFDNLQESSLWVGTPVYIVGRSLDGQWCLVVTPHIVAWIPSDGVVKTNEAFIKKWQEYAKRKMIAITRTNVSIFDDNRQYQVNAFVGAVFPGDECTGDNGSINILIPIVSGSDRSAQIVSARVGYEDAVQMPFEATPHNFSKVISVLLGRPYGWGNMYFYNDCSSELQSLYVPFGIWLPRQTFEQAKIGKMVDKTPENAEERIKYLLENGKKFTTILHTCGHVMLYIGNYPNQHANLSEPMLMTYQNIWGLRPDNGSYRAVIGRSVLFPILLSYPEDKNLSSLANRKCFQVIYLDAEKEMEDKDL
jgi:hypothetical protein